MARLSFENDGEQKMYNRGRQDALEEIFRSWHEELKEGNAFPDKNPEAFAKWGIEVLLPEINKYRGQDDLFDLMMKI